MADKTQEARARRTAGRDQRRARVAEPFEEMDEAAQDQAEDKSAPNGELARTAAKVVGSALAAALLGAAGAAAKGLLERRAGNEQKSPEQPGSEEDEKGAAQNMASPESQSTEQDDAPSEVQDTGEAEEETPQAAEDRDEQEEQDTDVTQGVSGGEAAEVVGQARRQLEGLLGVEPERVSGLARVNGGWSVMLEVVEVARVPESTDVLATYELKLDDDLNIVTLNRQRRYRRSQTDEAS